MPETQNRFTLITNLSQVCVNGVRTDTHALLLEDTPSWGDPEQRRFCVRGFGCDPAWPVFTLPVESVKYILTPGRSAAVVMRLVEGSEALDLKPLFTGGFLQLEGGPQLTLIAEDGAKVIDFESFEGGSDTICRVWEVLSRKTLEYWVAPNYPKLTYWSAKAARLMSGLSQKG